MLPQQVRRRGPTSTLTSPPAAATPTTPARELAHALTRALGGDGGQRVRRDTRVQQAASRLAELVNPQEKVPSNLDNFDDLHRGPSVPRFAAEQLTGPKRKQMDYTCYMEIERAIVRRE